MNQTRQKAWPWTLTPGKRRFETDFTLAVWFAGLWLFLKSFLYLCYLYMIGLEPGPYSLGTKVEIVYFAMAFIPSFLLAVALWDEKKGVLKPATAFFVIDTPLLLFHVLRLSGSGGLDSGLTMLLEFGSLGLNVISLGWLFSYQTLQKARL